MSMKNVVVAPLGGEVDALFVGIREFPTERVVLIAQKEQYGVAVKAKNDLERFKIPAKIKELKGNVMEEMFQIFSEVRQEEPNGNVLVNIGTGDALSMSAALSAAYVNGMKAFGVVHDAVVMLPVLKYSYYQLLADKKMNLLKLLYQKEGLSLEELGRKTSMSLPLLSYHINGNWRTEGLKQLGLVETFAMSKKSKLRLTALGKLLVKGYAKA